MATALHEPTTERNGTAQSSRFMPKPLTEKRRAAIVAVTGALKGDEQIWQAIEAERRADIKRENERDLV